MRAVLPIAVLATLLAGEPGPLAHDWQLVEGKHWRIASPDEHDTPEDLASTDACPGRMLEVRGRMKHDGAVTVEELQDTTCTSWIRREFPARCATFDETRWRTLAAALPTRAMAFCIDRFEWPNHRGGYPLVLVDWNEAAALCAREDKRLCTEDEWTFACEGEDALPYPYGYVRDASACVIDRPFRSIEHVTFSPRDGARTAAELDRLWQGEASGARARCTSPFGVFDLTGNVDEWTVSTQPGRRSILKGGYWGQVRTRCRPSTRAHGETFTFYQQGLRCCRDAAR